MANNILIERGRIQPPVIAATLAALLGLITVFAVGDRIYSDPDPLLHVAVGRWIIANRAVPSADVFSHSVLGTAWVPHEWLAEVLMAALYSRFGWGALTLATAVSFALTLWIITRSLLRYVGPMAAFSAAIAAWALCVPHLFARPHVFAWPLLALWIAGLAKARQSDSTPSLVCSVMLVPWANMHGSYMFGLAIAVLFAAEAAFQAKDQHDMRSTATQWGLFLFASVFAASLTPNGITNFLLPFKLTNMPFALSWIREWQSPNFQQLHPIEMWLLLLLFAALVSGVRLPAPRVAILLVLVHMALQNKRHGEILGIVSPFVIAPAIGTTLRELESRIGRLIFPAASAIPISSHVLQKLIILGSFAAATAIVVLQLPKARPAERWLPIGALEEVAKRGITGPVFNDYGLGGYLIFVGIAPFIDSRADMYGDAFLKRYASLNELPQILEQYQITWTLVRPDSSHSVLLDHLPQWRRIYTDQIAVVHVRDGQIPTSQKN